MIQLHASTSLLGLCQLLSSTEGECSRSASGVMMRSGAGKHTSASGVIYTGEWCEDKVCVYCVCTLRLMMYDPLWLLIHALSLCVRVSFTDAWQGDPAASLWSTLWRRIQRQHVPRHGNVHLPRRLYLQRSLSQEQVKSKLQSNRALNHWLVYSNPSLNVFLLLLFSFLAIQLCMFDVLTGML